MDIGILLGLQGVRDGAPGFVETFLSALSAIADGPGLVAIVLVVYWCVSKRAGQFAITAFMMGNLVSQFLKNIVCAYRPWIRDARIIPAESALEGAGGYSFPSGHTTGATTSLGSFAWLLRGTYRVVSIILIVIVALIAFSRVYLGVHTPQDVLVGLAIGVLAIWLTTRFFRWFENNQDKDVFVAAIVIAISVVTLIIVMVKPYPLDYVNGQLLVDPLEMQKGSFEASGVVIGVVLGWLFERRRVQFSTDSADIDPRGRIIRCVVGVVIVGLVYLGGNALFKAVLGILWGKFVAMLVLTFVAMFVVPLVFTWLERTRFVPYGGAAVPVRSSSRREGDVRRAESTRSGSETRRSGRSTDAGSGRARRDDSVDRPVRTNRTPRTDRAPRDGLYNTGQSAGDSWQAAAARADDMAQRSQSARFDLPEIPASAPEPAVAPDRNLGDLPSLDDAPTAQARSGLADIPSPTDNQ